MFKRFGAKFTGIKLLKVAQPKKITAIVMVNFYFRREMAQKGLPGLLFTFGKLPSQSAQMRVAYRRVEDNPLTPIAWGTGG